MSGLVVRSHMNAGQDDFRDSSFKNNSAALMNAIGLFEVSRVGGRSITPSAHCLESSGIRSPRLQVSRARVRPVSKLRLKRRRARILWIRVPGQHQLAGNANDFICERHDANSGGLRFRNSTARTRHFYCGHCVPAGADRWPLPPGCVAIPHRRDARSPQPNLTCGR